MTSEQSGTERSAHCKPSEASERTVVSPRRWGASTQHGGRCRRAEPWSRSSRPLDESSGSTQRPGTRPLLDRTCLACFGAPPSGSGRLSGSGAQPRSRGRQSARSRRERPNPSGCLPHRRDLAEPGEEPEGASRVARECATRRCEPGGRLDGGLRLPPFGWHLSGSHRRAPRTARTASFGRPERPACDLLVSTGPEGPRRAPERLVESLSVRRRNNDSASVSTDASAFRDGGFHLDRTSHSG